METLAERRYGDVAELARLELTRAVDRFGQFASPHEGWAVIREECDELWEEVKANRGREPRAIREAIQIAAMALRYVNDLGGDS